MTNFSTPTPTPPYESSGHYISIPDISFLAGSPVWMDTNNITAPESLLNNISGVLGRPWTD